MQKYLAFLGEGALPLTPNIGSAPGLRLQSVTCSRLILIFSRIFRSLCAKLREKLSATNAKVFGVLGSFPAPDPGHLPHRQFLNLPLIALLFINENYWPHLCKVVEAADISHGRHFDTCRDVSGECTYQLVKLSPCCPRVTPPPMSPLFQLEN